MRRVFSLEVVAMGLMITLEGCAREAPSQQDVGAPVEIVTGGSDRLLKPAIGSPPRTAEPQAQALAPAADRDDPSAAAPTQPPEQSIVTPSPADENLYRAMHGSEPRQMGTALSLPVQQDTTIR